MPVEIVSTQNLFRVRRPINRPTGSLFPKESGSVAYGSLSVGEMRPPFDLEDRTHYFSTNMSSGGMPETLEQDLLSN
jgi:hypothetical protein